MELAAKIQDKEQQAFILSGILAFTDKIIDRETAKRIMEAIEMTQIAKMYEEEKKRAVAQTEKETAFRSIIETCQELGVSLTDTIARIASKFSITQAESEIKVREYWK